MMERPRPQSKVSLEDLIRLKRAERPAPEFWADFEDQLRRKQLAAIVDKRPWWRRLSTASLAKLSLPVGATAVIAFTLVSFRDRAQPVPDTSDRSAAVATRSSTPATSERVPRASRDDESATELASAKQSAATSEASPSSLSPATVVAVDSSHSSAEAGAGATVSTQTIAEPSLAQVILGLEGITESDARPHYQADAPLMASMDTIRDGLTPAVAPTLEMTPASQITSSRDGRRARLLASVDTQEQGELIAGNSRVARSRERIASRLTERSLYDSISRLGLNGDSVTIKF